MVSGELPLEITDEEARAGFILEDGHVILALGRGLFAVKILHAGEVRYAICDAAMELIYPTASSLEELGTRFDVKNVGASERLA